MLPTGVSSILGKRSGPVEQPESAVLPVPTAPAAFFSLRARTAGLHPTNVHSASVLLKSSGEFEQIQWRSRRKPVKMAQSHDDIPADWLAEFEAARTRSLEERFRYSFIRTYKPVLDDSKYRSFDTMAEYRQWCEDNLPDWLGYGRV